MNRDEILVALLIQDDQNDPKLIAARAYADALVEVKGYDPREPRDRTGKWASAGPGVHEMTVGHHKLRVVRLNNAAGGPKYHARYTNPRGETRVVAQGEKLSDVKREAVANAPFPSGQQRGRSAQRPAVSQQSPAAVQREREVEQLRRNNEAREPFVVEKLRRDAQRAVDNRTALRQLVALPSGQIHRIPNGFVMRRPDGKFEVHVGARTMVLPITGAARYAAGNA